jgi:predicted short-subunit dehydrogenase-like oxidoreductase (DUF2520 family)
MVEPSPWSGKPTVAIVGAGRVGSALAGALHAAGYPISVVWSRAGTSARTLADRVGASTCPLQEVVRHADLIVIAVSDDAVAAVAADLARRQEEHAGRMAIHCSGVLPATVLAPLGRAGMEIGAFHPLVAIPDREAPLPPGITFAVEAREPLRGLLWRVANDLRGRPFDLAAEARAWYHAAAVIASNYTVVLAAIATDVLQYAGVPTDDALVALMPLLGSTMLNLEQHGLPQALTGPLARGDAGTISHHLDALRKVTPDIAEVYRTLGHAALPLVERRGNLDAATLDRLRVALGSQEEPCEFPHDKYSA